MARVISPRRSVSPAVLMLMGAVLAVAGCQVQPPESVPFLTERALPARPVPPPPFPGSDAALLGFAVPGSNAPFRYALDPGSITRGRDGVMRYVVVISAPGGVRNVLYQGMRCGARQYLTYAVGFGGGPFAPVRRLRWRRLGDGSDGYLGVLYRDYLCDSFGAPRAPHAVLRLLRRPGWTEGAGDG